MTDKIPTWKDERTRVYLVGAVVALGFFVLLFWRAIFVVIVPGHAGVLYDLFRGTRLGAYEREGLHVKLPWNQMYIYDLRLQSTPVKVNALSREGMVVDMDVVVLFRPNPREVALLHREIGPEYAQRTVTPLSIGAVREYVAKHDSHELYTVDADALKRDIMEATRAEMGKHHIVVDNVILERLVLPKNVLDAIEQKLTQEQIAAAYGFRLEAEKAEAQRLEIKGTALNRYYSLVQSALTPSLLTWRGIEATVELAQSPNSKIVIVGSGKDQLPLILGSDLGKLPDPRTAVPAPPAEGKPAPPAAPRVFGRGATTTPAPATPGPATLPSGVPIR
jgi:regulator of protease activity HflC (stomatin/prohibitin superfamily)